MSRKQSMSEALEALIEPLVARQVSQQLRSELARMAAEGLITFRDPELLDADLDERFGVVPRTAAAAAAKRRPGA